MAEKDLENRVSSLETNFAVFVQEMRDFKDEMRDFKAEMRQQNEMRAAEISALRQQHSADMQELRTEIKSTLKHIQIVTITTIIGVVTIAATFIGFSLSNKNDNSAPVQTPTSQTLQIQTAEKTE